MDGRKWVYLIIALVVTAIVVITVIWATGQVVNCMPRHYMKLFDPAKVGDDVWEVEVEYIRGNCVPDYLEYSEVKVILKIGDSTLMSVNPIVNGLLGSSDGVSLFFEDNEVMGRFDTGDSFYLEGLEPGSIYSLTIVEAEHSELLDWVTIAP